MPPVHFDGLRDYIVSRKSSALKASEMFSFRAGFETMVEYLSTGTTYHDTHAYSYDGQFSLTTISSGTTETTTFDPWDYNHTHMYSDRFMTATNRSSGIIYDGPAIGTLWGFTYWPALAWRNFAYTGRAPRRPFAGRSIMGGAYMKIAGVRLYDNHDAYRAIVNIGQSFVPGYRMFGYDYTHPDEAYYGTGVTSSSRSMTNGYVDTYSYGTVNSSESLTNSISEFKVFIAKSNKSFEIWKYVKGAGFYTSENGTIDNGSMYFLNDKTNLSDFNLLNNSLYDYISSKCSGWEEVSLRGAVSDAAQFKIYGIIFIEKHSEITFDTSYSHGSTPRVKYSRLTADSYGVNSYTTDYQPPITIAGGKTGTFLNEHVRTTV